MEEGWDSERVMATDERREAERERKRILYTVHLPRQGQRVPSPGLFVQRMSDHRGTWSVRPGSTVPFEMAMARVRPGPRLA